MKLQFFDSLTEATSYAADELIATLQDDLESMSFAEEHLYSDDERAEMNARLEDIHTAAPMMAAAPEMLAALRRCLAALNETPNFRVPALNNRASYDIAGEITRLIHSVEPAISPVQQAKDLTPFWFRAIHSYDGLELAKVAAYEDRDGIEFCERVDDPQDAQFWSVYAHLPEGGVECLEDFATEQEALAFANRLLELFPNLRKHGLLRV